MMRISILLFTAALGLIVGLAIHFADDMPALYSYTGAKYCQDCHSSTAAGEIYQVWRETAHARARATLETDQATEHIRQSGQSIDACLKCHTTLGRTGLSDHERHVNNEGVGCERCHGPGSEYSQTTIMKNREAFTRNGGSPGELANCYSCHAREPSAQTPHCPFQTEGFDAEKAWPGIAHPVRSSRSYSDSVGILDSILEVVTGPQ